MPNWKLRLKAIVVTGVFLSFSCGHALAQAITEFPLPTPSSRPLPITVGPDGALWFVNQASMVNSIGRITTSGAITTFAIPTPSSDTESIVAGPDGALWFTEGVGNIGRITTSGTITEFPIPTANSLPLSIAAGSDGALWFTELRGNKIGRITTTGTITEFALPTANTRPGFITAGPDGALWFTETSTNKIGRINTAGTLTEFPVPTANASLNGITSAPDGAIWFLEAGSNNKIGRITMAGAITEFPGPAGDTFLEGITVGPDGALWVTEDVSAKIARVALNGTVSQEFNLAANTSPYGITSGPDGAIWFTELSGNQIGRLLPAPPTGASPLVSALLPTSRSVQVGNSATFFASMINGGSSTLNNCRIEPSTFVNGNFSYRTTDSATNALTGTSNTAVTISAHGLQTFVLAYRAGAPFPPTDVQFRYICDGVNAATNIAGVNTMLLVFDANPVADMIAVGLTPSNDGFSRTGGNTGTGIFAVATDNIGVATALTARPRLSDSSLPLTVTLCETNAQAQCKAPPAATVSRSFGNNEASTFSIFLTATGAIAADPAKYRVFLEFVDANNVVRGSTSTAVTTQ